MQNAYEGLRQSAVNVYEERLENAKRKVFGAQKERRSIGTLSEKSLHAILKNFYEPDEDKQEIPIDKFVADIYADGKIIEIQTAQFQRMREKLSIFLPLYQVTVVYPIAYRKWVVWIDDESGELSGKRLSPKKGSSYFIFPELYRIKQFLTDPNLRIKLVLLDIEEYRILNGWGKDKKNHASKFDRVPTRFVEEVVLERREDYLQFVPYTLEDGFTLKEFAKEAGISISLAGIVLHILHHLGTVSRIGKKGNAFLYACEKNEERESDDI
jgi:hypothetical protein